MNRMPSLFVSHGAPTFAIEPGIAGPLLTALGAALPMPKAVLVVSPHWMTRGAYVGTVPMPQTIHDFGGFPRELFQLQYPAQGHPPMAQRAIELLNQAGWSAHADISRGLDHGAWVPLRFLYPAANVPVFQVSMPVDLTAQSALQFGQALSPLADKGVLIIGSGSLTHNLAEFRGLSGQTESYVIEFVQWVRRAVLRGDQDSLVRALELAPHAQRAHPSDDHLLPLMVALGAARSALPVTVLEGGVSYGMLSMESYVFGWKENIA